MKNILLSSNEDGNPSATVVGLVSSLIPIAMMIAHYYNLPLTQDQVYALVTQTGIMVSAGVTIFGIARKIVNRGIPSA